MEEINVAKLLKYCPSGMELDCVMYEDVYFDYVDELNIIHCYIQRETHKTSVTFNQHGAYNSVVKSKCVIFPKGKTTWEGFKPPCGFKDGDIVATAAGRWIGITEGGEKEGFIPTYCVIKSCGGFEAYFGRKEKWRFDRFATEEEKQKLFDAIKENGYKWNPQEKTLEKLIKSKFHVGDWVTDGVSKCQICFIDDTQYWYAENCILGSIETVDKQYHLWNINKDAKDGDVLFHSDSASNGIFIFKEISQCGTMQKVICYCDYDSEDGFCLGENHTCCWTDSKILHPATKEQRDLLFSKMKEAGYEWVAETKTLDRLVEPKFKVGDRVLWNYDTGIPRTISKVELASKRGYVYWIDCEGCSSGWWDETELTPIPNKFDITTLKPFKSKVLVRDYDNQIWMPTFWGKYLEDDSNCSYLTTNGCYKYLIPYEGNEYLCGKTDDCSPFFKTWE